MGVDMQGGGERLSGHRWTRIVTGAAAAGGTLCFGLAGLDEQLVIGRAAQARVTSEINNFVVTGRTWEIEVSCRSGAGVRARPRRAEGGFR